MQNINKKIIFNKKFLTGFSYLIVLIILILPVVSLGAGLVPCGTSENPQACDFNALMELINTVIHFVLFNLAVPIAAIMFAYAGILLITAGGAEAKSRAKSIFSNAVMGLVLAAAAWLIIRTILSVLGYDGTWIGF